MDRRVQDKVEWKDVVHGLWSICMLLTRLLVVLHDSALHSSTVSLFCGCVATNVSVMWDRNMRSLVDLEITEDILFIL